MLQITVKYVNFPNHSGLMYKHSIENLRLIAYGKFSKIVASWTEKSIHIITDGY